MNRLTEICEKFSLFSKEIFGENLVGVYLHGSAVMGCYNPDKSDIDLIVVVNETPSDEIKRSFMNMVIELNEIAPEKGIEMSVVKRGYCRNFLYPTPFELHFSPMHLNWYKEKPDDYIADMKGEDKDLAAHFTLIRHRGQCLYGIPIDEVFADVPSKYYLDSIWEDICEAENDIIDNPMYIILNLARVLAFVKEGSVLSKKEDGDWAVKNIPCNYHSLIESALSDYSGNKATYSKDMCVNYAEYMLDEIKETGKIYES
ncbi:MAG: DUF4111 domain-containing protein [Clostridia bacterium]|nr:DUF4111 domain-containing protein [Clostridia bacterium]